VDGDNIPEWVLRVAAPKNRELDNKSLPEKVKDTLLQGAEYGPWLIRHREAVTRPIIDEFLSALKQDPEIKALFSVGFCWGARYSILYARDGAFECAGQHFASAGLTVQQRRSG
jgi:dienelactone hydrolase